MMEETNPLWERKLVFVERGLLGFEKYREYTLTVYDEQTPFYQLTADQDPETTFIVIEPAFLANDYSFDLSDEDAELLKIQKPEDALVLLLITIPENPAEMSANLLGPLIFNQKTNQGKQVVLENSDYPVRYPIFPDGLPEEET